MIIILIGVLSTEMNDMLLADVNLNLLVICLLNLNFIIGKCETFFAEFQFLCLVFVRFDFSLGGCRFYAAEVVVALEYLHCQGKVMFTIENLIK